MIIKSFTAKNVFGYLNFDIKFNKDISFLVGGNGSGKTTALKLINALVNPNFKDLLLIPFEKISMRVESKNDIIDIFATERDGEIVLGISTSEQELTLPSYSNLEIDYFTHRRDKIDEMISNINRKNADHIVTKKISEIRSPIFLGLDRKREEPSRNREDYYLEREMWLHAKNKRALAAKRLIKGSLGASLMETEMLVQNSYRRLRELEDRQSNKLRDGILLSAFQYSKHAGDSFEPDIFQYKERSGLLKRQKEIKEAISKIGVKSSRLSTEVDNFFSQITSLFERLSNSEEGLSIEWLLNKVQIEKISNIVEIIDEHKSKVDDLFKPINSFLSTVNNFYQDSNKKLEINTVGQLVVIRPNGEKGTIEGLSSGERQLLVIFAHAFFNRHRNNSATFIIDEPELSLHLKWQEMFAETIFSISPNSQFILATHSPEIIGQNKRKAVRCR